MKKGQMILLGICTLSLCIIIGIFLGRNLPDRYTPHWLDVVNQEIEVSDDTEIPQVHQTEEGPLDLNTATKVQLMELPGIGEVLAQRILDYKQAQGAFVSTEDLLHVQGIGEKKLEQIEPFVKIGG